MKRSIAIIIIAIIVAFGICLGVTLSTNNPDISQLPDSNVGPELRQYPEIKWPTDGIAAKIPSLEWARCGEILMNDTDDFCGLIGYSTTDDFTAYVDACRNAGYAEEYYDAENHSYYGKDSDGCTILLDYNEQDRCVVVRAKGE